MVESAAVESNEQNRTLECRKSKFAKLDSTDESSGSGEFKLPVTLSFGQRIPTG